MEDIQKMRHHIILLVIGFVLTTVAGSTFAFWLQENSKQEDRDFTVFQNNLSETKSIYNEVVKLVTKRLYRTKKLAQALDISIDDKEFNKRKQDYIDTLYLWNDSFQLNLANLETHFGREVEKEFYCDITIHGFIETFRLLHPYINGTKDRGQSTVEERKLIDSIINNTYGVSHRFAKRLNRQIASGVVLGVELNSTITSQPNCKT